MTGRPPAELRRLAMRAEDAGQTAAAAGYRRHAEALEREQPPTLELAMTRFRERKRAMGLGGMAPEEIDEQAMRRLWTGLEVDVDDLFGAQESVGHYFEYVAETADIDLAVYGVAASAFTEGVATGLLLAELRRTYETRKDL